jgi:hypothetical protein
MAIDFNTAPYYDDFEKSSNYYRILFKPGKAVQARELTQMQSMLQNQIEQMGKNIFKDGSVIVGGKSFVNTGSYVKVQETTSISAFEGQTVVGGTSGARAIVRKTTPIQTIGGTSYDAALHLVYISGTFVANETITIDGTNTSVTSLNNALTYTGQTLFFSIDESVFFTKGHFVYCVPQTAVVSPTFKYQPSARLGLKIVEGIKTSEDDSSLLDPAVGTNNYFAPGADRYFIDLELNTIEYNPDIEDSDTTVIEEFIEVCNVRRGSVISLALTTQYNEIENALARRTYDESGDYTVRPFVAKVKDHLYGNTQLISVEVSPGKAYVRGHEFETIAPSYINMERARDTEDVNGYSIALDYGSYVTVSNVRGLFNFTESQSVVLQKVYGNAISAASSSAYFGNAVGNARIRHLKYDAGDTYKFYLFDVKLDTGNTFSEVRSIAIANITASAVVSSCNIYGNSTITYGADDTFLFKAPQENIKTFSQTGLSPFTTDTTYQSARNFSSVSFAAGTGGYAGNSVATITVTGTDNFLGTGVISDDSIKDRFYAVVTNVTGGVAYPVVGQVLDLTGANGEVEISGQNAFLRFKSGNTFSANIIATISSSQAASKIKTLTTSNVVWLAANGNAYINLNVSDVYDVLSITDASGNSHISSYKLDNGQRDDYYDHSNLILKVGVAGPILNANTNPNVTVRFRYFAHSGSGAYFDVDSYIKGGTDWGLIPSYEPTKGNPVRLSDVVDFRPVRAPASTTFTSVQSPIPGSLFTADLKYYLPRKDKLALTKERKLSVVKGIPASSPTLPSDLPDSMTLYAIDVPAYTFKPGDVKLTYVDNKRFTMRDIGKIEKRVNKLEYYSSLSLLEKAASEERIPSDIPGVDRFKNGILVDSFAGHSVSDVNNGDLRCSIDFENRLLRPKFNSTSFQYTVNTSDSSNFSKSKNLVTISYGEEPFVVQTKATNTVSATPFEVFTWNGTMTLSPGTDVWADTTRNPTVVVNLNGENDAFSQITPSSTGLNPWGTRWNDWQSVMRGLSDVNVDTQSITNIDNKVTVDNAGKVTITPSATPDITTSVTKTYQESFARSGLQISSGSKTITTNLGEKVVDSSIIPFIRSRPVTFAARNLKPSTKLYATFDGYDVTEYCTPGVSIQLQGTVANNISTVTVGSYAQGTVLLQRGNVLYLSANVRLNLPATGNIATLVSPTSTTTANIVAVNYTGNLITDASGDIAGIFVIPNNNNLKFNIGERPFRLADNLDKRFITTVAETKYLAYGLSQTKEDTILSTRVNLVSIDPLLEVRSGGSATASTINTNRGISTTGMSYDVPVGSPVGNTSSISQTVSSSPNTPPNTTLAINDSTVAIVNGASPESTAIVQESIQTVSLGEDIQSTGQSGIFTFRIYTGPGTGNVTVKCWSGAVPDKFILNYNGQDIVGHWRCTAPTDNGPALEALGKLQLRLIELGYPEAGAVTAPNANPHELTFNKQIDGSEYATLTVYAPLGGTTWRFQVTGALSVSGVPQAVPDTAPVAGRIDLGGRGVLCLTTQDIENNGVVTQTAFTDLVVLGWVRNATENINWKPIYFNNVLSAYEVPVEKSFTINSLSLDTSELTMSAGCSVTLLTSGNTSKIYPGCIFPGYYDVDYSNAYFVYFPTPLLLVNGVQQFGIRIQKPTGGIIEGPLRINATATGPGADTKNVFIDSQVLQISTKRGVDQATYVDPLSQTFFVDNRTYPSGLFTSSVDLWFAEKDSTVPVVVEIRPVVNGYPSSAEIVPFAYKVINASEVVASETFSKEAYTRITFDDPVYLPPGQYALVVKANSKKYRLYSAVLGEFQLDNSDIRVTEQPYVGSLFKSQNASTWTSEQLEDLTFRLNKCKFNTNTPSVVVLDTEAPVTGNVDYDVFFTTGEALQFADTSINYAYKGTVKSTNLADSEYKRYLLGSNLPMTARKVINPNQDGDLKLKVELRTTDGSIAPVIDQERLASVLVRNIINNDATGEDSYSGGSALARYITRRVTLSPGFEAQDLRVYVDAYCPGSSSIKVYYKVNAPGTTQFDSENKYVEMVAASTTEDTRSSFAEYMFETASGTCLPDSARFNIFVIKIVMLSPDPTQVPILKDLRVIALDE